MKLVRSNGRLVVFFGPDGSGKTTQAKLLTSYFIKRGYKVKQVWIRSNHSLAALVSKIFIILGYFRIAFSPDGDAYKIFDIRFLPKLKKIWCFLEFLSVLPWILFKVNFPLLLGYVVIADRYLVDTVVTIAYSFTDTNFISGFIAKVLLRMIPHNSFFIHLDANTKIILRRRNVERIQRDFIEFQKKWYTLFALSFGALSINTSNKKVYNTFNEIIENIYKIE